VDPDTPFQVYVYSRYPAVNVFLNGKPVQATPANASYSTQFTATFSVPYAAGNLTTVAYDESGKVADRRTLLSAGAAAALRLDVDRPKIKASRSDLAYVTVSVVDAEGRVVANADAVVSVKVTGAAELAALGTGNPEDTASFFQGARRVYRGQAVAVVRPSLGSDGMTVQSGEATVTVSAAGLQGASCTVEVGGSK
jgi:beta-galactosidase